MRGRLILFLVVMSLGACSTLRPGDTAGVSWVPSPNFDQRRPNYIILHATSNNTAQQALSTLTNPARQVSAHYLIGRDGQVFQLVEAQQRAWHAGLSWWGGQTDMNSASLGIELDNNGEEPFPELQLVALQSLLQRLVDTHRIPPANVIAHGDVAPTRKVDPSRYFPWQWLSQQGFGRWCQPEPGQGASLDEGLGLMALGYDIRDPDAARRAFKRHFLGEDDSPALGAKGRDMLACLIGWPMSKALGITAPAAPTESGSK